nr:FliH/SctL family protein [Modestobacter marinus]
MRGAPAAGAVPYRRAPEGAPVWGRPSAVRPAAEDAVAPAPAAPVPPPRAPRAPSVVPPAAPVDPPATQPTAPHPTAAHPAAQHPAAQHPTAAHSDQAATARVGLRLGEVYAEQLARLRAEARREGWAAGHAEGLVAAERVVRAAEQAAEERLAEVQARWERRLASATAAMGAAVERLDGTAAPVVDELRDSILDAVVILVGDLFGRELAVAAEPGLDALRRAMTLCPDDVPVVVRLHPDDLAEVPAEALAQLPASVTVRGDEGVERAGAVAEAGTQRVDAQLSAALDRVREVLRS